MSDKEALKEAIEWIQDVAGEFAFAWGEWDAKTRKLYVKLLEGLEEAIEILRKEYKDRYGEELDDRQI